MSLCAESYFSGHERLAELQYQFDQGAEHQGKGEGEDIMEELEGIAETNSDSFHSVGIGRFKLTGNDQLVCIECGPMN